MFYTVSLITIFNPIAAAAIMLSLVKYSEIKDVSKRTSIAVLISSFVTMIAGGYILKIFGINIPSIKAIGGVVLLLMAIHMIQGNEVSSTRSTHEEHQAAQERDDVALIPLAIPIIFGPGSFTTIIVLNEKAKHLIQKGFLAIAIVISTLTIYLTLVNADKISRFLGVNGLKITTRIMGLIIGAIAFLFLVSGIKALWMAA
ncbi:MAG: NAAT family transporter [Epsilonproteobacteria bacterium]|nr:NAAT family transporter [Campylobacterota bacterium]